MTMNRYKAGDHFVTADGESFRDNDGDNRPLDAHPHEVVGAAEKPLQVGDRVRAIRGRPAGKNGTIIEDNGDGMPLVKFDGWHDGHDGNCECGDSGYWCLEEYLERIEEPGFKKGDRVRALDSRPAGKIGTVVALNDVRSQVLVAFDDWRDGHNGAAAGLDLNGSGWWLPPADLECIEEPAFKVGDRVRFTDKCRRTWWFGPHTEYKEGVITADDGGGMYDVKVPGTSTPAFIIASDQIELAPSSPTRHAIVAAIENGKPKPAHRPVVHPDRATAAKEAQRLARVNPGKEFGVYELAETRSTAAPKHEWQRLAAAGRRSDAVSELMRVAGVAAPSAFSAVDRFRNAA